MPTRGNRITAPSVLALATLAVTLLTTRPAKAQQLVERARSACEATTPGSAERLAALLDEVPVLLRYDLRLAMQRAVEAVRLAEQIHDDEACAVAHSLRARAAVQTLGPEASKEALQAARASLPDDAQRRTKGLVEMAAAIVHLALDEPPECLAALRKALDHAEAARDEETQIRTHFMAMRLVGKPIEAADEADELAGMALRLGHEGLILQTRVFHTMTREQTGALERADEDYDVLLRTARELGDRTTESFLALSRGMHHAGDETERALQFADRALATAQALGDREQTATAHEFRSKLLTHLGREDEARAAIAAALEQLEGSGMLERTQQVLTTAAYLASLRGEGEAARRYGARVNDLTKQIEKRSSAEQRSRLWSEMTQLRSELRDEIETYRQTADDYAQRFTTTVIVSSVALLALLGTATVLLLRNQRRVRKTNQELQDAMATSQELQDEREALSQNLQQIERLESIGLLAGGFAHDFNNILVAVRGNSELLLTDEQDHERRKMIEEVLQASDRAASLCKDILSYAHATPTPKQPTDLREVMQGLVPLAKAGFGSGVEVTVDVGDAPRTVDADRTQIEQVFLNILVNAGDAVGDRGHIHVSIDTQRLDGRPPTGNWFGEFTGEPRDCVAVSVLDNGQGMDAETIRRIFDPFFSTRFAGRGLGLAAVFGILRRHDGIVEVQSTIGRGTQFTVYLPEHGERPPSDAERAALPEAVIPTPSSPPDPGAGPAATILVVDDEPDVCTVATRLFESQGHAVLTAHGGLEALELAECYSDRIELALLDVTMPDMDGPTLAKHLRSKRPDLPVVLMTGHAESAVRSDGLAGPLVLKPFDLKRLTAIVRDELATRS